VSDAYFGIKNVTDNLQVFTITHTGNVGIGTTSPQQKLQVNDTATSAFVVTSAGQVGIGTTGPNTALTVRSTNSNTARFISTQPNNFILLNVNDNNNDSTAIRIEANNDAANQVSLRFYTNNNLEGGSIERMRITGTGNVGIGTTSPGAKLELSGYGVNSANLRLTNTYTGGRSWELQTGIPGVSDAYFGIKNVTDNLQVFTITHTGNVGIGTTGPGVKLDVVGQFRASGESYFTGGSYSDPAPGVGAALKISATSNFAAGTGLFSGNVGIGTTAPTSKLHVVESGPGGTDRAGLYSQSTTTSSGNSTSRGLSAWTYFSGTSGTLTGLQGIQSAVYASGNGGTVNFAESLALEAWLNTGATISNLSMIKVNTPNNSGTIGTLKGIEIEPMSGATNAWAIYQGGTSDRSYFGGSVGIGTTNPAYRLELPNIANASGQGRANAWQTYSDIRFKTNINTIENALEKVKILRGVYFDWKNQGIRDIGFIAQEVEKVIPEIVSTDINGIKSLDYGRLTALLTQAIKEQQTQIDSLNTDLNLTSTGDLKITEVQSSHAERDPASREKFKVQNEKTGELIERIAAFAQTVIGEIKAGLVSAKEIVTDKLTVTADNLTIAGKTLAQYIDDRINQFLTTNSLLLTTNQKVVSPVIETEEIQLKTQNPKLKTTTENAKLEITDKDNAPIAQFNTDEKKTTLFGSLEVKNEQNKGKLAEVVIKGLNDAVVARIDSQGNASFSGTLAAKEVQSEKAKVQILEGQEASLSGKLIAKEVEAENINQLNQQLANQSADINQIQQLLAQLKDAPLPDTANMTNLSNTINLENLTVTGNTNLYNLNVSNSLVVGNLLIENDKILSLSWELKLSALSQISFFDQAVTIAKDGTITTKGALIAQRGIRTNQISPISADDNITIKLNSKSQAPNSNQITNNKLQITNQLGEEVASIDASGSAFFKALSLEKFTPATPSALIVSPLDNFQKRGVFAPAIETASASAGIGLLPQNQQEVIIYNDNVKEDSLIYITPQSSLPYKLTIAEKANGYFKVITDTTNHPDIKFDWLIIN
jgi:hypothetical protein